MKETTQERTDVNELTPIYSIDDRPTWDEYFIQQAFAVSSRSDDLFIKQGAILVADDSHHPIGTGYNNTIRKMDLNLVNPTNRDVRRPKMKHAERNCMDNATHKPFYLPCPTTMYITGLPCIPCLEDMINFGIKTIVYVDRDGTITEDESTAKWRAELTNHYRSTVSFRTLPISNRFVQKGLALIAPH